MREEKDKGHDFDYLDLTLQAEIYWCKRCGVIKYKPFDTVLGKSKVKTSYEIPGVYIAQSGEPWCEW